MRTAEVLRRASGYLARHEVTSPLPTAERLLADVLGTDRTGLYLREQGLTSAESRSFGRALCLRCAGTPVQHITGEQAFRRLTLRVRPGVFIPRPETETLVQVALQALEGLASPMVVDVGTGSGAVALAIADEHPGARIWATDRAEAAVALARENAGRLGLDVRVLQGDLLTPVPEDLRGEIDLVVMNPPYVPADAYEALPIEVRADPIEALVGGIEGYERLAVVAGRWLHHGGMLVAEIGEDQGQEVTRVMDDAGFVGSRIHLDLAGRDRVVVAAWP